MKGKVLKRGSDAQKLPKGGAAKTGNTKPAGSNAKSAR